MSTSRTAAVIACRVLGLYVAVRWLGLFPTWAFELFSVRPISWATVGGVASFAMPIALGVILWQLAPWIADCMLADSEDKQTPPSPITMEDAQAVAISILGLLLIVGSIPRIISLAMEYLRISEIVGDASDHAMMSANTFNAIVMSVIEIALGLWLYLGTHLFVRLFQRCYSPKADGS